MSISEKVEEIKDADEIFDQDELDAGEEDHRSSLAKKRPSEEMKQSEQAEGGEKLNIFEI